MFYRSGRKILIGLISSTLLSTALTAVKAADDRDTYHLLDSQGNPVLTQRQEECVQTPKTPNTPVKLLKECGDILDRDKDGVPDNEDICPDNTRDEISKGVYDDKVPPRRPINRPPQELDDQIGCPIDTDGDTVKNYLDVCVNTERKLVLEDRRQGIGTCIHMSGIRIGCEIDRDGDGTPDCFDDCLEPNKDTDGDGVADCFDRCPDTPMGKIVMSSGCHDHDFFLDDVTFDYDKADLRPRGKATLDKIISNIQNQLGIETLESIAVVGYTDNIGSNQYNQGLSEKRAASVAKYFKTHLKKGNYSLIHEGGGKNPECLPPQNSKPSKAERMRCRRVDIIVEPPVTITGDNN